MRTGSAWSRSEWLRRLGFKTGDEPPIALAIQPTLGSGDASELLPPLLAPQGWASGVTAVPGAGVYAAIEVTGSAAGGCFMRPDVIHGWLLTINDTVPGTYTPGAALAIQTEVGDVRTLVSQGTFSALPADRVQFGDLVGGATLQEFIAPEIYIGPGRRAYLIRAIAANFFSSAIHIRDVPVGLAPD